jgi:hypothetical protein
LITTAASAWIVPAGNLVKLVDGTHDLNTHVFKMALFNSSFSVATTTYSTTNELSTANGYTQGGATLANITLGESSNVVTFDADNVVWTASGGSIAARYAVIYNNTDGAKTILAYCLLDTTPADVTATTGNTLTVTINAAGILTITES